MSAVNSRQTRPDDVDASCRIPVLMLVLGGLFWLVVGLVLSLAANMTLQHPAWGGCEYFGYGKLAAAAWVAMIYGFAVPTALGVGIWVLFRMADTPIRTGLAVAAGAGIWNVGVASGVLGIILGETSGILGFEFPAYTGGIFLAAYFLIGLAVLSGFGLSAGGTLKLPQLMVIGAMLWFPWLLTTAQVLAVWLPSRGVLPALIGSWYSQGLFWGCLAPLTLAALWYLRSESVNPSLPRPGLALLGYWALLVLAGWTGASALVGGPVPAWIASTGVVAGVLLIIPVVLLGLNLFGAVGQPAGQLATLSSLSFVLAGVLTALTSLRCANRILHLTLFPTALEELLLLGFVTLGLLAALYVILPRVVGFAWPRGPLTLAHLGLSTLGLGLCFLALLVGGWLQGQRLNVPGLPVNLINAGSIKFLRIQSLGLLIFLGAQLAFVAHLALMATRHFPTVKQFALGLIQDELQATRATIPSVK